MHGAKGRVLVAEDNFVLSQVIQFNLEQAGYSVTLAADGHEAIEQLSTGQFDLVISDYQMPRADAADICNHIRQTLGNWKLPIMLCSAKGLELDAKFLEEHWHLAGVFYKPFSVRDMLSQIQRVLAAPPLSVEPASAASR